jgi:hypothetical protein
LFRPMKNSGIDALSTRGSGRRGNLASRPLRLVLGRLPWASSHRHRQPGRRLASEIARDQKASLA